MIRGSQVEVAQPSVARLYGREWKRGGYARVQVKGMKADERYLDKHSYNHATVWVLIEAR